MGKVLTNLNEFSSKYSGLISLLQVLTPAVLIACFYVFTLYMDANYVNRQEYQNDKDKTEKVFEEIKGKLNVIIIGQTAASAQMTGVHSVLTDHAERLRYIERKDPVARR